MKSFFDSKALKYYRDFSGAAGGDNQDNDMDIDDPQLTLALKMSLEDQLQQAQRQSAAAQQEPDAPKDAEKKD